jgi:hypothetical protein
MKFLQHIINESINDKGILHACFMAGHPCAGKSYTLDRVNSGSVDARIVNTDKFFEFLGMTGDVIDKSKQLTKKQLVLYLNSMLPLFIDGTASNPNAIMRRSGILESLGYKTGMVFINTDIDTAMKRLDYRRRKVPTDFLKKTFDKMDELKPFYKNKFQFFMEIKNNWDELDNNVINDASNAVASFFSSPNTPIGDSIIKNMKKNHWKYLTEGAFSFEYLNKLVSIWYTK